MGRPGEELRYLRIGGPVGEHVGCIVRDEGPERQAGGCQDLRTFMREDWSDDAVAMAFTNKVVGSHGHKDALSVSMYAYGKFLLVDPGYGAVLTGNIRNYMISPQQHNILTVNDYENYLPYGKHWSARTPNGARAEPVY